MKGATASCLRAGIVLDEASSLGKVLGLYLGPVCWTFIWERSARVATPPVQQQGELQHAAEERHRHEVHSRRPDVGTRWSPRAGSLVLAIDKITSDQPSMRRM